MSNVVIGYLVWIPDGTTDHGAKKIPIKGPTYGLVLNVLDQAFGYPPTPLNWLEIQAGSNTYTVDERDIRKMDGEKIYG